MKNEQTYVECPECGKNFEIHAGCECGISYLDYKEIIKCQEELCNE
jgi:hypothetical protein